MVWTELVKECIENCTRFNTLDECDAYIEIFSEKSKVRGEILNSDDPDRGFVMMMAREKQDFDGVLELLKDRRDYLAS